MRKTYPIILFLVLLSGVLSAQQNIITGEVFDAKTREPLPGVNIVVNELKAIGAASEADGKFIIKVPSGSYSITASLVGYQPVVKTDVIVRSGSEAHIIIPLIETTVELGQVTVRADYFDKGSKDNNLSTVVLGAEEIRRSPGSAQDFQRILQGMAGVSFSNDQNNELIVRGGAPDENLTVFDNMEIHSTNHYPNEYNSGGPINMINVDLIEDIQFSTGGFISKYGDKLSSVMNVTSREGTRNSLLGGNLNLGMAGYGTVLEGAINGGKGSWIVSARKSYIDLIKGAIGLTAVPRYYDIQFKAAYDLSTIHKLSWSGIYGNDKINFEGENEAENRSLSGGMDSTGTDRLDVKQIQYATGMTLRSLWSDNLYSLATIYYNNYINDVWVKQDFVERSFNDAGRLSNTRVINTRDIFNQKSNNGTIAFKGEVVWNIDKYQELNTGGFLGTANFNEDFYVRGDSARYFINGRWSPTVVSAASTQHYDIRLFDNYKTYAYVNEKLKLIDNRLILNLGLRYDYFTYSKKGNISPRFSATYYLVPAVTNINFAYGDYYQTQNYPTYGDKYHQDINRYLKNTHARHVVLGAEHVLDDGLKMTLEGYYKKYDDIPVEETFINFEDRTLRSERRINTGRQTSYGVDFMLQQKLVKDIYGTLSYSRMWSRQEDPRLGRQGEDFASEYEFPHVLTLIVGKRFKDLRQDINKMPFFIKYPCYLLPFSNDMEISLRWRYASGKPYTPKEFVTTEQFYEGETRWSKGSWVPSEAINSARYPDYHRLDLSFSSRYNFNSWNLVVFLSVENIYNRKNIAQYEYNSDGSIDTVYQFSLFPVAGIELEF